MSREASAKVLAADDIDEREQSKSCWGVKILLAVLEDTKIWIAGML
mgnify:CR=1 FL=1